jgi:putative transposase
MAAAKAPKDWDYSSFHRHVQESGYDHAWRSGAGKSFEIDLASE